MNGSTIVNIGFFVLVAGILLIFLGSIIQSTSSDKDNGSKTEIKTGGVILIGPIPIIFGNDRGMIMTGVILGIILMLVAYFLFYRH